MCGGDWRLGDKAQSYACASHKDLHTQCTKSLEVRPDPIYFLLFLVDQANFKTLYAAATGTYR